MSHFASRVSAILLLCLGLADVAHAGPDLMTGRFASTEAGCQKLKETPIDQIEEFDFKILTSTGIQAYEEGCDFLQIVTRARAGEAPLGWLVSAICEYPGFAYPEQFAITPLDDRSLQVTAHTEVARATVENEASAGRQYWLCD